VQNDSKLSLTLCHLMMVMTENSKARKSKMHTSTVDTMQSHIIDITCTATPLLAHFSLAVKQTLHTSMHAYERQILSGQTDRQADRQT